MSATTHEAAQRGGAIGHADEWAAMTIRDRARQVFLREHDKVTLKTESRLTLIPREGALC